MAQRLFGVETEYALTGLDAKGVPLDRVNVLRRLMRSARERMPHLLDGTGRGVFLANGARLYIDYPDHPEFSTPECATPWDVVRYVQAGERILTALSADLVARERRVAEVVVLRCNVDYSGSRTTWGCHESYLHRTDPRVFPAQIMPHLISRIIYTGAGGFNSRMPHCLEFTLSPRVWHLEHEISEQSTHSRGIFHTKEESLSSEGYSRLHILCGESLCSETAAWLKVGVTALVVALIDGGVRPGNGVQLRSPLAAMQRFAEDPTCRTTAHVESGAEISALAIQRHYLTLAEAHLHESFMPPWAAEVCQRWRAVLDQLDRASASVATQLDWSIKLALYHERARRRGIRWESLPHWNHVISELANALAHSNTPDKRPSVAVLLSEHSPVAAEVRHLTPYLRVHGLTWDGLDPFIELRQELFEIDARFGQLGEKGIFAALDRAGVLAHRVEGIDNIEHAVEHPPSAGRARVRGEHVRQLTAKTPQYMCDWRGIWDAAGKRTLDLSDPFETAAQWKDWQPSEYELHSLRLRLREGVGLD